MAANVQRTQNILYQKLRKNLVDAGAKKNRKQLELYFEEFTNLFRNKEIAQKDKELLDSSRYLIDYLRNRESMSILFNITKL